MHQDIEYPYKSLHKYPGMRPRDVVLWDQLLVSQPGLFRRVWYDVHIGDPAADHTKVTMMKESGMFDVSCWCIDVLADAGDAYWVIEIKPNAAGGALGQALAYTALLQKEWQLDKPVRPAVLTDDIAPITQQAAAALGVALFTP